MHITLQTTYPKVYSDEEIESVLLAYINQAAALFHIPSLGQQVDIMITYLGMQRLVVCLKIKNSLFYHRNTEI